MDINSWLYVFTTGIILFFLSILIFIFNNKDISIFTWFIFYLSFIILIIAFAIYLFSDNVVILHYDLVCYEDDWMDNAI